MQVFSYLTKKPAHRSVLVSQTLLAYRLPGVHLRLDDNPFPGGNATPQLLDQYKVCQKRCQGFVRGNIYKSYIRISVTETNTQTCLLELAHAFLR